MSKTMEDVFDLAESHVFLEKDLSRRAGQILFVITIAEANHTELSPEVQALRKALQSFQQWHSRGTPESTSPMQSMFE